MKEYFKTIDGYSDYQISNLGRVKSLKKGKERILKPGGDYRGAKSVALTNGTKSKSYGVHVLVAMAFLKYQPGNRKIVVDHIDNDPTNNHPLNLQIITQRQNIFKNRKGSSKYIGVSWNAEWKKWVSQITINKKVSLIGAFDDEKEAAKAYQIKLKEIGE